MKISSPSAQSGTPLKPQTVFPAVKTYSRLRKHSSYVGYSTRPYRSPRLRHRATAYSAHEDDSESTFGDDELDEEEEDTHATILGGAALSKPATSNPDNIISLGLRRPSPCGYTDTTSQWSNGLSTGLSLTVSDDHDLGSTFKGVMSVTSDYTWQYSTIKDGDLMDIEQPRRAPPTDGSLGCLAPGFFQKECIAIVKDILLSGEDEVVLVSESEDSHCDMPEPVIPPSITHPRPKDAFLDLPLNSTLLDHSRALPRPQALQPFMSPIDGGSNRFHSSNQTSFSQATEKPTKATCHRKSYKYMSSNCAKSPDDPDLSAVSPLSTGAGDVSAHVDVPLTPSITLVPEAQKDSPKPGPLKPQRTASTPHHSSQNSKAPLPPAFSMELSSVRPNLSSSDMQFNETHTVNSDEIHVSTPEITGPYLPADPQHDQHDGQHVAICLGNRNACTASTPYHASQNSKAPLPPAFSMEFSSVRHNLSSSDLQFNVTDTLNSVEIHVSTPEITGPYLPADPKSDHHDGQRASLPVVPLALAEPEHIIETPAMPISMRLGNRKRETSAAPKKKGSMKKKKVPNRAQGESDKMSPMAKMLPLQSTYDPCLGRLPPRPRCRAKHPCIPECILTLPEDFPSKPVIYYMIKHPKTMSKTHIAKNVPTDILEYLL